MAPRNPTSGAISISVSTEPWPQRLQRWDEFVRAHPAGDVVQLSGWARIRERVGFRPVYVMVDRGGRLVGGAQVLVRRVRGLGAIGYLSYGPLATPFGDDRGLVERALADAVAELGRRTRMLFVQPPHGAHHTSAALLHHGFRVSDAGIAPAASLRVDLAVDEAALLAGLSRRLRRWTRQWPRRGVTVRPGTEADLPAVAQLLAHTAGHQRFNPFDLGYLATMYRELAPSGDLAVFVGEVDGRPVAVEVFTGCGGTLKGRLVGLNRDSDAARLNVAAAIRWAAMTWARRSGYRWFDLGGLHEATVRALTSGAPVDPDSLDGPDRFKVRFGGVPYRYPQPVEVIASPLLRTAYDLARGSAAGRGLLTWAKQVIRSGSGSPHRVRLADAS